MPRHAAVDADDESAASSPVPFERVPRGVAWCVVVGGIALSWGIGYAAGGADEVPPHWFYLPVIFAAVRFGLRGVAVGAPLAGVVAGPLLPAEVDGGVAQDVADIVVRLVFLAVVGAAIALAVGVTRRVLVRELEDLRFDQRLRQAARRHEFTVEYQPVVDLRTGGVAGFEALVRWDHPTVGRLPPAAFVPVAEDTGAIVDIGEEILRTACRAAVALQAAIGDRADHLLVSVNVSPRQLVEPGFVRRVATVLDDTALRPEWLHLEVTETALMADLDVSAEALRTLRELGVRVALDDFGTGHSTFAQLQRLPVDIVKIDRSFVDALDAGGQEEVVSQAVLRLAHGLGLATVAEGVERAEQVRRLESLGCSLAQGYLFARALPLDEFERLLRREQPFRALVD